MACFINPTMKTWDKEKLGLYISNEHLNEVAKVPISLSSAEDKVIWRFTKSGIYNVKSGYAHQTISNQRGKPSLPSCSYSPSVTMWKKMCSIPTLPKIRVFMWKVLKNWIACRANLVRRKCGSNPNCPICEEDNETMEHLLFHCPGVGLFGLGVARPIGFFRKRS